MLHRKKENEVRTDEEETRYMLFLNYCVSKSIGAVLCFIVWAVTKGEDDKLRGIRQEML